MLTRRTTLSTPGLRAKGRIQSSEGEAPDEAPAETPDEASREATDEAPAETPDETPGEAPDGGEAWPEGPEGESARTISRQTLEQTPGRVHHFLRGVGTSVVIRARLAARGYSKTVHAQGWRLLQATSGFFEGAAPGGEADDMAVRKAIVEIDGWDETGFRIINASLRARHPAQHSFLTQGLRAAAGLEAVTGVATLLERLDALEGAPEREGTRAADRAALATLSERGIDGAERRRLRALVARAQGFAERFDEPNERAKAERRMREALAELRLWYEEWSEMARVTFKRRDELIRLGLASRRIRRGAGEPDSGGGPAGEPEPEGAAV